MAERAWYGIRTRTHVAVPLVELDIAGEHVCELAADEETRRGEVVRVGKGDPPGLGGHRASCEVGCCARTVAWLFAVICCVLMLVVASSDDDYHGINSVVTLYFIPHQTLVHYTHNVQQGIYRQDGHGPAGERAAVSVYTVSAAASIAAKNPQCRPLQTRPLCSIDGRRAHRNIL